jgi:metallo-beta-lactamase family protein
LKILLPDSGYLQEEDARRANRYGYTRHQPAEPLYTQGDAEHCLSRLTPRPFNETFEPVDGVQATFTRAGHIIGSACLALRIGGTTVTFSGDVGRPNDPIMKPPAPLAATDDLVIESTYGDRRHPASDELAALSMPTLIVPGADVRHPELLARRCSELIPRAALAPGVLTAEIRNLEEFNAAVAPVVAGFLDANPPGQSSLMRARTM